jgi:hypothetical protein
MSGRFSFSLAMALLTVVGWAGFVPSAQASCGDYVVYRSMPAKHGPTAALPAHRPVKNDSPTRLPCHGPHCERSSLPPLAPARLVTPPPSVELGCVASAQSIPQADLIGELAEPHLGYPTHLISPVYHPPR